MISAELEAEVQGLRARAADIQDSYSRERKDIDSDISLSEAGKQAAWDEAEAEARSSAKALREKEITLVKNRIRSLQTQLDAKIGYGATDIIAFRDAQDRADRVADKETAARLMGQALRNNDRTMAHALFRKASESGWSEAAQQFAAENPDSAAAAKEIESLEKLLSSGSFQRTLSYMIARY
ncbi:hypothetical protein [Curtobacterium sp. MCLR17_042]|uniref:hypothetical protein n=1 Tax=Curtobacterium sp. MCLR17_042 TaxID=2175626 RepID=UPI000DA7A55A|nr:hypothetical protein [Curtobacterium sp. MCLR17_042]PZE26246.1 hypothetical protein DEJ02_12305 [Curtobacterium sp. MCLR17_042]